MKWYLCVGSISERLMVCTPDRNYYINDVTEITPERVVIDTDDPVDLILLVAHYNTNNCEYALADPVAVLTAWKAGRDL